MANEIYDSTWWGNTIDTASSIGTSTEMIQGQFNLTKIGDEEVTNGDFDTDSNWVKQSGWSINNGTANCDGTSGSIYQNSVVEIGKSYLCEFEVTSIISGSVAINSGGNTTGTSRTSVGTYSEILYVVGGSNDRAYIISQSFQGSIDNVSIKEARATTVEASKCLADTIHRIGLQDIQN